MEGSSESQSKGLDTSRVSDRNNDRSRDLGFRKETDKALAHVGYLRNHFGVSKISEDELSTDPFVRTLEWGDVSLRQWLDRPDRSVDVFECMHIFRQIVEIVNVAHSQGIVVHNVRPSCFVMSSFNHVSFIESASCSDSGSDSIEEGSNSQPVEDFQHIAKFDGEDFQVGMARTNALSLESSLEDPGRHKFSDRRFEQLNEEKMEHFPMKQILIIETSWYTSPEEDTGSTSTCSSDVYRLGVLLFELFCPVNSREDKTRTMSSLRHRVLPPQLLLKWSKEASFCLWLLHPDPSSRPTIGQLLESEFLNEPRDDLEERETAIELRERIEEQELLLEFLFSIQQRKREAADKLQNMVSFLCSDIEEVVKQRLVLKEKGGSCQDLSKDNQYPSQPLTSTSENDDPLISISRKRFRQAIQTNALQEYYGSLDLNQESILLRSSRLMRNFKKLESAYFSARCRQIKPPGKSSAKHSSVSSDGRGSIVITERTSVRNVAFKDHSGDTGQGVWINPFLEGLCKYLSFSKLRIKEDLKQGDLLNSSNLVCSIGFDRDGELLATAGVNKKIKVFECDAIMDESRDIHYPLVEMASRSKLSSICWNTYIKSQIASSDFDGVVQVWDVTRSQLLTEMRDHEKRVWSVDFSSADPTLLASGSDDGSVKLWSINQGVSIGTIKAKANVCCVQFPLDSGHSLAFGSADHKVYYYDLRNPKIPLCTMIGHNKTVSYVKFVDATTLVSSSTDNSLKLWDLSMCQSGVNDSPIHSFTGHTNVKNFVGLSVSDGYIATGSETNEVFVYHKAFPMPVLSFKFNNPDPISGLEMDDAAQFISSVCWRGQSSTLVAANSTGNIKILEMV